MTVLPGSLDYLYHNGILDHIPYYAYEGANIGMNNSMNPGMNPYANMATGMGSVNAMGGYGSLGAVPQMNTNQYMHTAQQGTLYNAYNAPDAFVRAGNTNVRTGEGYSFSKSAFGVGNGVGDKVDYEKMAFGEEGKSFRESIMDAASSTKRTVSNSPDWVKGLLASGLMLVTLCLFLRTGKKPSKVVVEQQVKKSNFWSKLNPKNWFKKK